MRFYYISIFSVLLLGLIYLVGTGLLTWFGLWLRKRWKKAWMVMVPLFLLLYAGPVAEEFWIAWNFDRFCKKDAGISIYKTVEVDGFYDDTTHWWRQLAESDYQFVESRDNTYGGLWRVERNGRELRHFKIDQPSAQYRFSKPHSHTIVAHRINMFEYLVENVTSGEVLGREKTYARGAPWFFIGLDRPTIFCNVSGLDGEKMHATIYDIVLKGVHLPK